MDAGKRVTNLRKHGIDFRDAEGIFPGLTATVADNRFDYDGRCFIGFGSLRGTVVAMAHIERGDRIRVIPIRKATKNEQEAYLKEIAD